MGALFGSAPQATFSTQPTISPDQTGLLGILTNLLGQTPGTVQPAQGTFAAPVTGPQQDVLSQLQGLLPGSPINAAQLGIGTGAVNQALTTLGGVQGYTPQQITAPQVGTPQFAQPAPATATNIDPNAAYQQGVVAPLTQNFNQNVLPGIAGQFGQSAGGAFSSGALQARETAGTNLNETLAQTGAQYQLGAAQANQQANLQASLANLSAGLTGASANQNAALTTGGENLNATLQALLANQGAGLSAEGLKANAANTAGGLAQTAATLPSTAQAGETNPLLAILSSLGLPQQTAQTQITGSYGNAQQSLADLIASFSPSTQQTLGVGTGGTTGIIQSLLAGLAGNAGVGNAISNLFA